jgi:hypothetical protein
MGGRDILTLVFILSTITASAVAGAYTYSYYQFYPALRTLDLKISSFQYAPTSSSLNSQVVFNIENPSSYNGLTMTAVLPSLSILPPGRSSIAQGLLGYQLPRNAPVPLGSGKAASFTVPYNGSGSAPGQVNAMILNHTATQSQFIFNYQVEVYLSTFMDTYATIIILYVCSAQGTTGTCQQGVISLATKGPSSSPGGGGGV